jgi:intron-binding protein aquarius
LTYRSGTGSDLSPFSVLLSTDAHESEVHFRLLLEKLLDQFSDIDNANLYDYFLMFMKLCVHSLEYKTVRNAFMRYFSLPIWYSLSIHRRDKELAKDQKLKAMWKQLDQHRVTLYQPTDHSEETAETEGTKKKGGKRKRTAKQDEEASKKASTERNLRVRLFERDSQSLPNLLKLYFQKLSSLSFPAKQPAQDTQTSLGSVKNILRICDLFIDLLSQHSTRKYFRILLDDSLFVVKSKHSEFYLSTNLKSTVQKHQELFHQLVDQIQELISLPLNPQEEGKLQELEESTEAFNEQLSTLQTLAFQLFPEKLKDLVYSSLGLLSKKDVLHSFLRLLETEELSLFARKLHLLEPEQETSSSTLPTNDEKMNSFLMDLFFHKFCNNSYQRFMNKLKKISCYPTEEIIFNQLKVPFYSSSTLVSERPIISLPKLNLQFLSFEDYLWRNFILFRSENFSSIREDIIDAVKKSGPKKLFNGSILFHGWSRHALPVLTMTIDEVEKPKIGDIVPARVTSTITIDISRFGGSIQDEWESLKEHDVLFLISFDTPNLDYSNQMEEFEKEKSLIESGNRPTSLKGTLKEEEIENFLKNYGKQRISSTFYFAK